LPAIRFDGARYRNMATEASVRISLLNIRLNASVNTNVMATKETAKAFSTILQKWKDLVFQSGLKIQTEAAPLLWQVRTIVSIYRGDYFACCDVKTDGS
jgi:hypothetical protein